MLQVLEEGMGTQRLRASSRYVFLRSFRDNDCCCAWPRPVYEEQTPSGRGEPEAPPHYTPPSSRRVSNLVQARVHQASARSQAALLAHLPVDRRCWDCMRDRPGNCGHYFLTPPSPSAETRALPSAQEAVEEPAQGVLPRAQGDQGKECHARFCVDMVHQASHERMARTLRNCTRRAKRTSAALSSLIATDVLAPKLHSKAECRDGRTMPPPRCASSSR